MGHNMEQYQEGSKASGVLLARGLRIVPTPETPEFVLPLF